MKTRYYLLLAAIGLLAGCAKEAQEIENTVDNPSNAKTVLVVGISDDLKTNLGDPENGKRKVFWSNGDQIAVNGTSSEALENIAAGTASASFTFNAVLSTPYNVLYPASAYVDASHINFPSVQSYKAGGIADNMLPLAGYSTDGSNLSLSHLCAMVKISVLRSAAATPDVDNIACVRFKGRNGEKVSGNLEITYTGTPALTAAAAATDLEHEVRVNKNLATSTTDAVDYYLIVPARQYASGFDIIIQDVNGHIMTKSITASKTFEAGHLYSYPAIEFVPTGTELGVEISNAEELIAFATAYNNKEYAALGSNLIATVTQDIAFDATSSAAFNATGGIGTSGDTNRFDGIFNGNGKTISGLESTVVMFNGTTSSSTIKDLTLDNTCSFTFTNPKSGNFEKGAIVGYHRGVLDNVKVAADVSLAEVSDVTSVTALGGLVGRIVVGSIENGCEYSGLISTPAVYSSSAKVIIGGLAGEITNASGSISDSFFKGAISNEAQETEGTDQDNPYLIIGGIVGQLSAGTVSSCNTTSDHETVAGAYSGSLGHIVNKTIVAYCSAVGGIVGENVAGTVSACQNEASIFVTLFKKDNNNNYGRRTSTGGIVGINQSGGTVTGCTNSAAVTHRSNTYFQYLGGVVGRNYGTVSSCSNSDVGSLKMMTAGAGSYSARYPHIGGVIAENRSTANVSDLHNAGDISLSRTENNNNAVYTYIGGVIGLNSKAIDGGTGKNITNSGDILQNYTPSVFSADGFNLGGIVGKTTAAVSNVSNSGSVKYEKTTEGGDNTNNTGAFCIGGIAGRATAAISGANNTGEVYFLNNLPNVASTGGYNVGGIVGISTSAVTGSTNEGYVHYRQQTGALLNNVRLGGVAGYINAGETAGVNNNANSGEVYFRADVQGTAGSVEYHYIYFGGIIGYGKSLDIDNCHNTGYVHGGQGSANLNQANTVIAGGVIGYLNGTSSITNCSHSGADLYNDHWSNRDSNAYDGTLTGGIAGITYGTESSRISIEECTVSGDATCVRSRRGSIGGILGSGIYSDLSDCTVSIEMDGTVSGRAQSGYNCGGIAGIVTNSTVTDCTFSGTTINSSQIKTGGGIVGKIITGTTVIDGCSSYVTSITKSGNAITAGSIVGTSVDGTTIQNCHYKTTYAIAGTGTFSGGGNVADL